MDKDMKVHGIPYFPYPSANNDNLKLLQAKFRLKGIAVYLTLTQKIYAHNGYYYAISDDIISLLKQELNLGATDNIISDIIDYCVKQEMWSKEMYDKYKILTSEEIQKEYLNAVRKRKNIHLVKDYLLGFALEFYKKTEERQKTAEETQKKAEDFDKEKKRKENKNKLKEIEDTPAGDDRPEPFEGESLSFEESIKMFKDSFPGIYTDDVKYIKEGVDMKQIILALQQSTWARHNLTLKTCIKHYDKLINGVYKDTAPPKGTTPNITTQNYNANDFNNLLKNLEDIEV